VTKPIFWRKLLSRVLHKSDYTAETIAYNIDIIAQEHGRHENIYQASGSRLTKQTNQLKNNKIRRNLALHYFEWVIYI
jgi:hypothetical protein